MANVKAQKQADHPRVEGAERESEASKVGFGEYAADWLRCRIDLAERTEELYRWLLDRHIEPTFASSTLDEIEPPDVRAWYASAARTHPTTAAKAYRLLSSIMRTAVSDELITRNPCQVRGAAVEKAPERPVATIAEVEALTRAMPASLRIAVLLAAWCQLRRGEVRGLRRCDIDLERGTLSVSITKTTSMGGRTIVKEPKTRAGRRTVTIPPHVMEPLSRHLDGYVGHTPDAFVVEASNRSLSAAWDRARSMVGREDLRFHDLRHSGLTWSAATGASVAELMRRAGHASQSAALRYQHATDDRDRALADALARLADGRRPEPDGA
jgi:integrase